MAPILRLMVRAARLVWEAHPRYTAAVLATALANSALPPATMLVAGRIVDGLMLPRDEGAWSGVTSALLLLGALLVAGQLLRSVRGYCQTLLEHVVTDRVGTLVVEKAGSLPLSFFETPDYYDKLQRAQQESSFRPLQIVQSALQVIQNVASIVGVIAVLLVMAPLATILLVGVFAPLLWVRARYGEQSFALVSGRTPETRRMMYLSHLLTADSAAKELRLLGLVRVLIAKRAALFRRFFEQDRALLVSREAATFLAGTLTVVALIAVSARVLSDVGAGVLSVGQLVVFCQGLLLLHGGLAAFTIGVAAMYEGGLFLRNLFEFLDLPGAAAEPTTGLPLMRPITTGFVLDRVTFTYPGGSRPALEDVTLEIPAGQVLALVGENGAGKTTLVKLLTGLYEPDRGTITLDGVPLGAYDAAALRAGLGVVFQDFTRFHATARENIGFGQVARIDDLASIREAGRAGGADAFLSALPDGYESMLGKWFEGGVDLSVGQWQAVAVSRAFLRDAQILVLDEPSAALDAKAEYQLFERLRVLSRRKTVLLVSHRFSTVQLADRIAVIDGGRLVELGSHAELLALGGRYAELYGRQAASYR